MKFLIDLLNVKFITNVSIYSNSFIYLYTNFGRSNMCVHRDYTIVWKNGKNKILFYTWNYFYFYLTLDLFSIKSFSWKLFSHSLLFGPKDCGWSP